VSQLPIPVSDPLAVLDEVPLSDDEAGYVDAARAANTCGATAATGGSGPPGATARASNPCRRASLGSPAISPSSPVTVPRWAP
jgi:hypothetical protein